MALLQERGVADALLIGDRPVVRTDARLVERVLANLLDNAATQGGGVAQVVIERLSDMVLVHVDDAGPGVPPEEAEQLFEPFARGSGTDVTHTGAGLGLAIAREAARALGGDVVFTGGGRGARVTLSIPEEGPL